jgi:hypothetical protein
MLRLARALTCAQQRRPDHRNRRQSLRTQAAEHPKAIEGQRITLTIILDVPIEGIAQSWTYHAYAEISARVASPIL